MESNPDVVKVFCPNTIDQRKISIFRDVQCKCDGGQVVNGDRMVIEYATGTTDELFIFRESRKALSVGRISTRLHMQGLNQPYSTSITPFFFVDNIPLDEQRGLLSIYTSLLEN